LTRPIVDHTAAGAVSDVVFHAGDPCIVIDHETRMAHGLIHWVDGTMGFHRHDGREIVIAPNGGRIARHEIHGADLAVAPTAADVGLSGELAASDHASGGPVYFDEEHQQLLLFYHGETFTDGDASDYYAYLGLAVSDDHGATFDDLGRIITSDLAADDPDRHRPVDVGSGAYVIRDGCFYVYFHDRGNGPVRRSLSVARARVDDVLDAARRRATPRFTKWCDGTWEEPGVGGRSAELFHTDPQWVVWFDVATIEPLGCDLLVYSTSWLVQGVPHWNYMTALSTDGVSWSSPQPLFAEAVTDEVIYLTIDSGGPRQRVITGDTFDLYRTRATTPFRWDHAWLERLTVSFEPAVRSATAMPDEAATR